MAAPGAPHGTSGHIFRCPGRVVSAAAVHPIVVLSFKRSGSSWLLSTLATSASSDLLYLGEMFNPGFPLAHLNIYSSDLHREVKGYFGAHLLAPRVEDDPKLREALQKGSLVAVASASASHNRSLHLGTAIADYGGAPALQLAAELAARRGLRHTLLKVFPEHQDPRRIQHPLSGASGQLPDLATYATDERALVLLLRRNFFHGHVSLLKVARTGFQNGDSSAFRPVVALDRLELEFAAHLEQTRKQIAVAGGCCAHLVPPYARGAAPGRAAMASVMYEELFNRPGGDAQAAQILLERLRAAGVELGCDADNASLAERFAAAPTAYVQQDRSNQLRQKIANYDEVYDFAMNNLSRICESVPGCPTDPVYALPP